MLIKNWWSHCFPVPLSLLKVSGKSETWAPRLVMITWQEGGHSLRHASVSQSSKPNPQSLSFPILKILNTYLPHGIILWASANRWDYVCRQTSQNLYEDIIWVLWIPASVNLSVGRWLIFHDILCMIGHFLEKLTSPTAETHLFFFYFINVYNL